MALLMLAWLGAVDSARAQPCSASLSAVIQDVSCFGGNNGAITVLVNGGTPPFSYLWNTVPPQTTATITGLVAGNYSIMVLDANTCTHTLSINVTQPAILAANITSSPTLCNGGSNGTATSNTTGGTSPYTYAWSNGQTTATATGLVVGSYTVTVTDNNGCSVGASVTVNQPSAMTASANGTNLTCPGVSTGSANVGVFGGNPPFSYAWSNGQTGFNATGLAAGTHTVTITDNNGCTATDAVTLTEPPDLIVGLTVTDVACNGGSDGAITAAASGGTGGLSYAWSNAQTGTTISTLASGSYTVTVTDVNNCTVTATGVVNEPAALSINLSTVNLTCNASGDGAVTAGVTGGTTPYSYAWSNGATTAGVTGLASGSYTVTVTDANGCSTSSGTALTEPTVLVANATAGSVSCFAGADGSAATAATGGTTPYTYAWTGGQTTANATGLTAGMFTVTLTDANGCSTTEVVTVTEPPDLTVALVGVDLVCNGINTGTATATPSGGTSPYTYAWSNAQATAMATGLAAGAHTVTVTDNNGCTETASVTLTQPALLSVTIAVQDVSCQGGSDGSVTASAAGGTASYTYAWSNGQTTPSLNGLVASSLAVTVTDANGCTTSGTASVNEPAALALSLSPTDLTCNGSGDGTIASTVTGGTVPYSYGWSNGQTAATAINLATGTYTLTVTDANGCTVNGSAIISEPTALTATLTSTDVSCNAGTDGSASVTAAGGTGAYTYLWSNGQTTAVAGNLPQGTYSVTVTDANACTVTGAVTLTEPPALLVNVSGTNILCFNGSDGSAAAAPSGGTGPYTFAWSGGQVAANIASQAAGTYTLTVTDNHGCTAIDSVTLSQPTALSASLTVTDVSCNGSMDGSIGAALSGGTVPYSYQWSDGQTTSTAANLAPGSYTLTVTDGNGCTISSTATVAQPAPLIVTTAVVDVLCFNGNGGSIATQVSGGNVPYSYSWSNGQSQDTAINLTSGTYTVTVTDNVGCSTQVTAMVSQPPPLFVPTTGTPVTCNGGADGTAQASPTGGTGAYTYSWPGGQTTAAVTGLSQGTYTVSVTDANGCLNTGTVSITEPTAVITNLTGTPISCNAGTDGSASVAPGGGVGPYTILWSGAQVTPAISGLSAGTYSVTVTDNQGCMAVDSIALTEPLPLAVPLVATAISCNGGSDGTVTSSPSGGMVPYSFQWSGGQTTAAISGQLPGTYSVTVTDANGCTLSNSASITQPPALNASRLFGHFRSVGGYGLTHSKGLVFVRPSAAGVG